jgi:hypothetical protein
MVAVTGWICSKCEDFNGTLDDLKQLHAQQTRTTSEPATSLHGLLYSPETDSGVLNYTYIHNAIYRNDTSMTKWLLEQGCQTTKFCHEYAAKNGNLEIIKLLFEHGQTYYNYYTITYSSKHIECFKYYFDRYTMYRKPEYTALERAQEFWNEEYHELNQNEVDLDDPVWRILLDINTPKYPVLTQRILEKKQELDVCIKICSDTLTKYLYKDLAVQFVYMYL